MMRPPLPESVYLVPAPGRRVPLEHDPGRYLPESGRRVPLSSYYARRIVADDAKIAPDPDAQEYGITKDRPERAPANKRRTHREENNA